MFPVGIESVFGDWIGQQIKNHRWGARGNGYSDNCSKERFTD